jgi:hypothetical protein
MKLAPGWMRAGGLALVGAALIGCDGGDGGGKALARFPEHGRIEFAGRQWTVRSSGDTPVPPGPNIFSDSGENVWVDDEGLHLRITHRDGKWQCAELIGDGTYGYGMYRFYLVGRPDRFNENIVVGLYTWDNAPPYDHREIDIELSRWGNVSNACAQFVVQPYYLTNNMDRYELTLTGDYSTHSFDWYHDRVDFQTVWGHYADPPAAQIYRQWTCSTPSVFPPGNEALHLNFWLFSGLPPTDGQEEEIVIRNVEFIPHGP